MADDIAVTPGSGATVAADEISSVKYQRVKLIHGADGVNAGDVSAANPYPVAPIAGQVGVQGGSGTTNALTQRVVLATDVALPAGTNAIGKLAANSGVDIGDVDVTSLPAIPAGNNNIGDVDIASIAAGNNNIGDVDIASMPGIVGTVADDATTPGNPVMIGGKAVETDGTDPTSVSAEDDVAILRTDRNRRLLVNDVHPNLWDANENHSSAQTNNELKAAPGANLCLYITDMILSNGATPGTISIVQDTGGSPVTRRGPYYFGINAGLTKRFKTPIRIPANTNVGFTSTSVTTHTVSLGGYIAP